MNEPQKQMRFMSLPRICCRLQKSPGAIESALKSLNIEPAIIFDDYQGYTPEQEATLDDYLREQEIERIKRQPKGKQ
jgi:hypothetical protein